MLILIFLGLMKMGDVERFFNENFFQKSRINGGAFEKDVFGGVPESHYEPSTKSWNEKKLSVRSGEANENFQTLNDFISEFTTEKAASGITFELISLCSRCVQSRYFALFSWWFKQFDHEKSWDDSDDDDIRGSHVQHVGSADDAQQENV